MSDTYKNSLTSCPHDGDILDYYKGCFESVYVLLHPFISSSTIDFKTRTPETWPRKKEMISECEEVSWKEVMKLAGFNSLSEIDVGLRTSIGGLKKDFSNDDFSERIQRLFDEKGISQDTEGDLQELLANRLFGALRDAGCTKLWVSNEFGDEKFFYSIDDIVTGDMLPPSANVYDEANSFLITTHWDSHCSFLCGSEEFLKNILKIEPFEGFFCTPKTKVYWGLHEV